jgi:hypothetical protein
MRKSNLEQGEGTPGNLWSFGASLEALYKRGTGVEDTSFWFFVGAFLNIGSPG